MEQHPLAPSHCRKVVVLEMSNELEIAKQRLKRAANTPAPRNADEIRAAGFVVVDSADLPFVFVRDSNGTRASKDDQLRVHTIGPDRCSAEELKELKEVRDEILGPRDKMGKGKAKYDSEAQTWRGGIAYERNERAKCLQNGDRCYPLSTVYQVPRQQDSPASGRKDYGGTSLDSHSLLTRKLLRVGARMGMRGIEENPMNFARELAKRSSVLNLLPIGTGSNTAFHATQLNIADADEPDNAHPERSGRIVTLGRAGFCHIDGGDSPGGKTAMLNLTEPHPDVEEEYFFIMELGLAIRMVPLYATIFSGLFFHTGHQVYYKIGPRTSKQLYVRATLINYCPSSILDGTSSSAFGLVGKDVIKLSHESKIWQDSFGWIRPPSAQATYLTDGATLMEPEDHFNYATRGFLQLITSLVLQLPKHYLARVDTEAFLGSFSFVKDGVRVGPKPWDHAPGWSGDDTRLGTQYTEDPATLDPEALARLHNSDTADATAPFNKPALEDLHASWEDHCRQQANNIPLCIVAEDRERMAKPRKDQPEPQIGGRAATRKALSAELRGKKDSESDDDAEALSDDQIQAKENKRKKKAARAKKKQDDQKAHPKAGEKQTVEKMAAFNQDRSSSDDEDSEMEQDGNSDDSYRPHKAPSGRAVAAEPLRAGSSRAPPLAAAQSQSSRTLGNPNTHLPTFTASTADASGTAVAKRPYKKQNIKDHMFDQGTQRR